MEWKVLPCIRPANAADVDNASGFDEPKTIFASARAPTAAYCLEALIELKYKQTSSENQLFYFAFEVAGG